MFLCFSSISLCRFVVSLDAKPYKISGFGVDRGRFFIGFGPRPWIHLENFSGEELSRRIRCSRQTLLANSVAQRPTIRTNEVQKQAGHKQDFLGLRWPKSRRADRMQERKKDTPRPRLKGFRLKENAKNRSTKNFQANHLATGGLELFRRTIFVEPGFPQPRTRERKKTKLNNKSFDQKLPGDPPGDRVPGTFLSNDFC